MTSVAEWTESFLDSGTTWSKKTRESYHYSLGIFTGWCEREAGITAGELLSSPTLLGFQRWLSTQRREDGTSMALVTQHRCLSVLRQFGAWLVQTGRLPTNPAAGLDLPKLPRQAARPPLSPESIALLMLQPNLGRPLGMRDRAILEVVYAVGLNGRELAGLTLAGFDRVAGTLEVPPSETSKPRTVPLGERATGWLDRYLVQARPLLMARFDLVDSGRLFVSQWGQPMEPGDFAVIAARHFASAGLPDKAALARLRDTLAVQLLSAGCDPRYLAALLGRNLQAVKRFRSHALVNLKAVHAKHHPSETGGLNLPEVE